MKKTKLILTLPALLTLVALQTAAHLGSVEYWSAYGTGGCIDGNHPGYYTASFNWKYPSASGAAGEKGGVNFKEYAADDRVSCTAAGLAGKNLHVVFQVKTATQLIPTVVTSDPQKKMVKYASKGSCDPALTTNMTPIVVTVTATHLTVECQGLNYKADGTTNHPIAFSRYK